MLLTCGLFDAAVNTLLPSAFDTGRYTIENTLFPMDNEVLAAFFAGRGAEQACRALRARNLWGIRAVLAVARCWRW